MFNTVDSQEFLCIELEGVTLDTPLVLTLLEYDSFDINHPYLLGVDSKLSNENLESLSKQTSYLAEKNSLLDWFERNPKRVENFNMEQICKYEYCVWLSESDYQNLENISVLKKHINLINDELNETTI